MSTIDEEEDELPSKGAPLGPKRSFIAEKYIIKLPPGLKALLEDLTRAVIKSKPSNIDLFAADFFSRLLEDRARDVGTIDFPKYLDDSEVKRKKKSFRSSLRKSKRSSVVHRASRDKDDESPDDDHGDDDSRSGSKKCQSCVCPVVPETATSGLRPQTSYSGNTYAESHGKRDTPNKVRPTLVKLSKEEDPDAFRSSRRTSQSRSTDMRSRAPSSSRPPPSGEQRFSVPGALTKAHVSARRDSTTQKPSIQQTDRESVRPSRLEPKKTGEVERVEYSRRKKSSMADKTTLTTVTTAKPIESLVSDQRKAEEPRDYRKPNPERTGRLSAPVAYGPSALVVPDQRRTSVIIDDKGTAKGTKKRASVSVDRRSTVDESTNIPETRPDVSRRSTVDEGTNIPSKLDVGKSDGKPRPPAVSRSKETVPVMSPLDAALNRKTVAPAKFAPKKVPSANVPGTEKKRAPESKVITTTTVTPTKTTVTKTTVTPLPLAGGPPKISIIPPDETPKPSVNPAADTVKKGRFGKPVKRDLLSPTDTSGTDSISVSEPGTSESESSKDNDKSKQKSKVKKTSWRK